MASRPQWSLLLLVWLVGLTGCQTGPRWLQPENLWKLNWVEAGSSEEAQFSIPNLPPDAAAPTGPPPYTDALEIELTPEAERVDPEASHTSIRRFPIWRRWSRR